MEDNVGLDVEVEGESSTTTTNGFWSIQTSHRFSDLAKVESVYHARENTMKNEIARLKNERKDLVREVARWKKMYSQVDGRISVLEALAVELQTGQPVIGDPTAGNGQISGDTS